MSSKDDYLRYLQTKQNYLLHYGVKGMKWRIRKDREVGNQNLNGVKNRRTNRNGKPVRGASELWEIGKAVVEAMLGGDEGVF